MIARRNDATREEPWQFIKNSPSPRACCDKEFSGNDEWRSRALVEMNAHSARFKPQRIRQIKPIFSMHEMPPGA